MIRSTSYLKKLRSITEKVAKKNEVNPGVVEDIFDDAMMQLKTSITDPKMPKIKLTNWGTYQPTIGKINWQIRQNLKYYRKGSITRERAVDRISHLWPIKQRLMKEKMGLETWKDWNNAKTED